MVTAGEEGASESRLRWGAGLRDLDGGRCPEGRVVGAEAAVAGAAWTAREEYQDGGVRPTVTPLS